MPPCSEQHHSRANASNPVTNWSNTQIKVHLDRLCDMEDVMMHRGGKQGQQYTYELAYNGEGENSKRFLMGLTDPATLRSTPKDCTRNHNFTG